MNTNEAAHQAQFTKEALEIISEYHETDRLMREQNWDGMTWHIQNIVEKYSAEVALYNANRPYSSGSYEQMGESCKNFLRCLLVLKEGEEVGRKLSE